MANLSKIIKISKSDYDTLAGGGSITKNGQTYTYDADAIYLITPQAVGSASQPIYINSNGDFVAGDEIPDVPTDLSDFNNDVGYTTNAGTVTSVNNTSPDANGNVSLTIPTVPTNLSDFNNDVGYTTNEGTVTDVQLNGSTVVSDGVANVRALPNFNLSISHQTAGNPRQVKFLTVDYNTKATYFKMGATSCHDNGTSYQFLEDIIIGCTTSGSVVCKVYKYCQQSCTLDNETKYYGDVFYVIDTTNKKVDFYILCGQYATSQFTPATKIGNTTIAYVTQYTGTAAYYSSGTKVWGDGNGMTISSVRGSASVPTTSNTLKSLNINGTDWKIYNPIGTSSQASQIVVADSSFNPTWTTSNYGTSSTKPLYLVSDGSLGACSTYAGGTKVTLNGTDKGASTASFYAATSAITTSTNKRYLLGSSSTTSMTTTNTNSSCYMSGGYLYSNGEKVCTRLYLHSITLVGSSGNDKVEINILYGSTSNTGKSTVADCFTNLKNNVASYVMCAGALRSVYFSACLPITRAYVSGTTMYYYYTLPFSNGNVTGSTSMAQSNFSSGSDVVVCSMYYS